MNTPNCCLQVITISDDELEEDQKPVFTLPSRKPAILHSNAPVERKDKGKAYFFSVSLSFTLSLLFSPFLSFTFPSISHFSPPLLLQEKTQSKGYREQVASDSIQVPLTVSNNNIKQDTHTHTL